MTTTAELLSQLQVSTLIPEQRAEIGRQLAEIGDPRRGVGLMNNGIPDMDWVEIPAGETTIGSPLGDLTAKMNEVPPYAVNLPTYYVSRYPITYAQYAAFVQADGYSNPRYWTKVGNQWAGNPVDAGRFQGFLQRFSSGNPGEKKTHPQALWNDPFWHLSNHPVVGVTWYEAAAFAAWLGEQLNTPVWLPTEEEWEKAARGTDGRRFPWGKQFYAQFANCGQTMQVDRFNREQEMTGIGRTTAVGIFAEGASPYGVMDMCGNVWEWCASVWRENYQVPASNVLEGDHDRVIRGGAWDEREINSRTTSRIACSPHQTGDNLGFRVCAAG